MLRSTTLVLVIALVACTPPGRPSTTEVSNTTPAALSQYEAAPIITPAAFNQPPDLRDKICDNQYGRGDSYDTVTKASNAFCR